MLRLARLTTKFRRITKFKGYSTIPTFSASFNPIPKDFEQQVLQVTEGRGTNTPQLLFMIGDKISQILQNGEDQNFHLVLEHYVKWCIELFESNDGWKTATDISIVEKADDYHHAKLPITWPECLALLGMLRLKSKSYSDAQTFLHEAIRHMKSSYFFNSSNIRRNMFKTQALLVSSYATMLDRQYENEIFSEMDEFIKLFTLSIRPPPVPTSDDLDDNAMVFPEEVLNWQEMPDCFKIMAQACYRLQQYNLPSFQHLLNLLELSKEIASIPKIGKQWLQLPQELEGIYLLCAARQSYLQRDIETTAKNAQLSVEKQLLLDDVSPAFLFEALHLQLTVAYHNGTLENLRARIEQISKKKNHSVKACVDAALFILYRNVNKPSKAFEHLKALRETSLKHFHQDQDNAPFVQSLFFTLSATYAATEVKDYSEAMRLYSQAIDLIIEHELKQSLTPVSPFSSLQVILLMAQLGYAPQKLFKNAQSILTDVYDKNRTDVWLSGMEPYILYTQGYIHDLESMTSNTSAESYEKAYSLLTSISPTHPFLYTILHQQRTVIGAKITMHGEKITSLAKELSQHEEEVRKIPASNPLRNQVEKQVESMKKSVEELKQSHADMIRSKNSMEAMSIKPLPTCVLV